MIAAIFYISKEHQFLLKNFYKLVPLFLFFLWIVFHYIFLSELKNIQLIELKGFWLRSFMSMIIGLVLGCMLINNSKEDVKDPTKNYGNIIYFSLFSAAFIYLVSYAVKVFSTKQLLFTNFYLFIFNETKPPVVIFVGILLTAMLSKLTVQFYFKERFFKTLIPLLFMLLCLFIFFTSSTKNGIIIFTVLVTAFGIKLFITPSLVRNRSIYLIGLTPLILLTLFFYIDNPAFKNMVYDIKLGVDINNNSYWKNWETGGELPLNELGNRANQSTYLRTAWFTVALRLIQENPFGYGLMSYSFSYLALKVWPEFYVSQQNNMVDTHSGWVDLTLAFGIPSTFLIIFSLASTFLRLQRKHDFWSVYASWTIIFILISFMLVEVAYSTFYELLFFLAAFFSMLTIEAVRIDKTAVPILSKVDANKSIDK
jgi:hypothetical protein